MQGSRDEEHEAYSSFRRDKYVYVTANEKNEVGIDAYVDGEENKPLVIVGSPGIGKSALLSNWIRQRQEKAVDWKHDFLFAHYVGCSPESYSLNCMLLRLESSLKSYFKLRKMEVPQSEERLRWSLFRFLNAAASSEKNRVSKYYASKIIIIIDGVNLLRNQDTQAGSLHWLPIDLPDCVRFILSTVEFDDNRNSEKSSSMSTHSKRYHITYKELMRRNCSMLKMVSLNNYVRLQIVSSFLNKYQTTSSTLILNDDQKMKISSSSNTSKPFFLRLLLSFLRFEKEMLPSAETANEHIDKLLNSSSTSNLISSILHCSSLYLFPQSKQQQHSKTIEKHTDIFFFILSVLLASRNGLSIEDICGLVKFKFRVQLTNHEIHILELILQDYCIQVRGCYIFAHITMQDTIFDLYISNPSANIQLHNIMAEYYKESQTVCVKKLSCIIWHLEVSAAWKKLKNILIDVENFNLWWNEGDRNEFIELWASLTETKQRQQQKRHREYKLVTGIFRSKWMSYDRKGRPDRPSYDPVEEYTRSLCAYWSKKTNCFDPFLHKVVLNIANFLLDFSVLGYELSANVPSFLHPSVSNTVMQKLGVPHVEFEDDLSVFLYPTNVSCDQKNTNEKEDKVVPSTSVPVPNVAPAANTTDPMPGTAYFFCRWIWIFFPLIAIGNINALKRLTLSNDLTNDNIEENEEDVDNENIKDETDAENTQKDQSLLTKDGLSIRCFENSYEKLDKNKISETKVAPLKKVTMKKNFKKNTSTSSKILMNAHDYEMQKEHIIKLLGKIKNEYDNMVQTRNKLIRQKKDMEKEHENSNEGIKKNNDLLPIHKVKLIQKQLENKKQKYLQEEALNKRYCEILKYCQENPANDRGLVRKLEAKVSMDSEQILKFEDILHQTNGEVTKMNRDCQSIKKSLLKNKDLHHKLIENRLQRRWNLERASNPHPHQREVTTGTSSGASVNTLKSPGRNAEAKSRSHNANAKSNRIINIMSEEKYQIMEDEIRHRTSDRVLSLKQLKYSILDQRQTQEMIGIKETIDKRLTSLRLTLEEKKRELDQILFENSNHQAHIGNVEKAKSNEVDTKHVSRSSKKEMLRLEQSIKVTVNALGAIRCSLENIIGNLKRFSVTSNLAFKKLSRLDLLEMVKDLERGVIALLKSKKLS